MAAIIQADANSLIENVNVSAVGVTDTAIEMFGNNARLLHSNCGTSGSEAIQIIIAGDNCYLEDVTASSTLDTGILVTGDRAQLVGISTASNGVTTGDAVRFEGSSDSVLIGLKSFQDSFGLRVLDSPRVQATNINIHDCSRIGVTWDGSDNGIFEGKISESDRHGLQITDSDRGRFSGQIVNAGRGTNNTYDGVFVDGDSDRNRTEFTVTYLGSGNRMRYGLNLSASTVDNHVEASILDGTGATGNYNNAGTGTVVTDDHLV